MAGLPSGPTGPGHTTACVADQNPEWWCGAQQTLYQEWLWMDGDMKKRTNTWHRDREERSSSHKDKYLGAGVAILAAVAMVWLMVIMVHENVKRREARRRILHAQGGYDDLDDIEHALGAEREEREQGQALSFE